MSVWEKWVMRHVPQRAQRALLLAVLLFGSVFSYLIISHFLLGLVEVRGASMAPTLAEGDSYVLHKWRILFRHPTRGQIVAIRDPLDDGYSVKRVIGLPHEEVAIRDGAVVVDGVVLPELYLSKKVVTSTHIEFPATFTLGAGEYFVMGDNRVSSLDGRFYGPIPRERILGVLHR